MLADADMGRPWLRLNTDYMIDPKLRRAGAEARLVWPPILAAMKPADGRLSDDDLDPEILSDLHGMSVDFWRTGINRIKAVGLLVRDGDKWTTPHWTEYQPDSRPSSRQRGDAQEPQGVPGRPRASQGAPGTDRESQGVPATGRDGTGHTRHDPPAAPSRVPARASGGERKEGSGAGPHRPPPAPLPGNLGGALGHLLPRHDEDDAASRRRFAAQIAAAETATGTSAQRRHTPDSLARHLGILRGVTIAPVHHDRLLAIHTASSDADIDARLAVTRDAAPDRPWAYFSRLFDAAGNPSPIIRPEAEETEEERERRETTPF